MITPELQSLLTARLHHAQAKHGPFLCFGEVVEAINEEITEVDIEIIREDEERVLDELLDVATIPLRYWLQRKGGA